LLPVRVLLCSIQAAMNTAPPAMNTIPLLCLLS
jgi:hypothetical protein